MNDNSEVQAPQGCRLAITIFIIVAYTLKKKRLAPTFITLS